jgi:hypothetical protein
MSKLKRKVIHANNNSNYVMQLQGYIKGAYKSTQWEINKQLSIKKDDLTVEQLTDIRNSLMNLNNRVDNAILEVDTLEEALLQKNLITK